MLKVIRTFPDSQEILKLERKVLKDFATVDVHVCHSEEDLINVCHDADYIIAGYEPFTKNVLDNLPNLKLLSFRSIGFNCVDLAHANSINLPVAHLTDYCITEVADYVISCILAYNRRLVDFNNSVKNDLEWDYAKFPNMRRLSTQKVGLIGFGNIARDVAKKLSVFGCEVFAYDPFVKPESFKELGVKQVSLEEIFENCDIISSHLPLNNQTDKMLNKELFSLAKKPFALINSSRGGVINEDDLTNALKEGKISYAFLDVLTDEDPDLKNNDLVKLNNVVLTPHMAFYSKDSWEQGTTQAAENIKYHITKEYDKIALVNREKINLEEK